MTVTIDQNGKRINRGIRKEQIDGVWLWGRNVWFGSGTVTDIRRYYYRTRLAAVQGDISDDIGKGGRVA